jgi:hypothetical protein
MPPSATVASVAQANVQASPQHLAPHVHATVQAVSSGIQTMPHPSAHAQALTLPLPERPAQLPLPAAMPVPQQMTQLQVLVPEPGLRAGQKLAFTAPAARPGAQPQPMTVTVNSDVLPGSIITVQYGTPSTQQPSSPLQALPIPQFGADYDRQQMNWGWLLYGVGWLCCCCFGPVAMACWGLGAALYFCRPPHQRSQMPQTRVTAYTSALTCLGCFVLCLMMIPLLALSSEMNDLDNNGDFDGQFNFHRDINGHLTGDFNGGFGHKAPKFLAPRPGKTDARPTSLSEQFGMPLWGGFKRMKEKEAGRSEGEEDDDDHEERREEEEDDDDDDEEEAAEEKGEAESEGDKEGKGEEADKEDEYEEADTGEAEETEKDDEKYEEGAEEEADEAGEPRIVFD